MDYRGLGKRIRTQRQYHHMTQEALAEHIGISLSFLGHIERGTRKASLETIMKIANELQLSLDYLFADSLQVHNPTPHAKDFSPRQWQALQEMARVMQDNMDAWTQD